jgi:hypothetical protein
MSGFKSMSAKSIMQNLIQMDAAGVDLSEPLNVYLPHDDTSDFIENGAYELYEVVSVGGNDNGGAQVTVQAVGGA